MSPKARIEHLNNRRQQYMAMGQVQQTTHLAAEREIIREHRRNYTTYQMVAELEASADRQRQVRLRSQVRIQRQLPVGRRCNIDSYNLNRVFYYDVGDMVWECCYCQALGFKDENKGKQTNIHFGQRCCNKDNMSTDRFPDLQNQSSSVVPRK